MKQNSKTFLKTAARSLILTATLLAALPVFAQQKGYNEIFDENGKVRVEYREAYLLWSRLTDEEKAKYLTTSRQRFEGDNAADAMPRIIPASEYDQVKKGVDQRARAIRAFLQDYFSGKKTYAKNNVIPESVVKNLTHRSVEEGFAGVVSPDQIAFMYGPDIIRDENGVWRVIEDNPGFIGGIGDLALAQKLVHEEFPVLGHMNRYRSPMEFYDRLATRMRLEAIKHGGKAVMYMQTPAPDNEDKRLRKLLADRGIQTITQNTDMQLSVEADGVYMTNILDRSGKKEKVGYIFMNGEHWYLDPSHPAAYERLVIGEATDLLEELNVKDKRESKEREAVLEALAEKPYNLKKILSLLKNSIYDNDIAKTMRKAAQAKGLTEAFLKGKVGMNYTPGIDFIGDKEFYVYVENMVRFYLKEEPILRNIETERLGEVGSERLNSEVFDRVFGNLSKYVIKKVDGRGGDAVWVGPKITPAEIPALKDRIMLKPSEYIVQAFTPLSYMNDIIVDMRVISQVSPRNILVTDVPWGRGLPMDGNGKVNLSDKGREVTIMVSEGPWRMCKNIHMH